MGKRIAEGETYTLKSSLANVYGDAFLPGAPGKNAAALRVSRAGGKPRYGTRVPYDTVRRVAYPLVAGPQELVAEALDEAGQVVVSMKFTVVSEVKKTESNPIPSLKEKIEAEKKKPRPDRVMLCSQYIWLAKEYPPDQAWATLMEVEKDYGDVIGNKDHAFFYFQERHAVALRRDDLAEAVATMERWAAAEPEKKAHCYQIIAEDYIVLEHDIPKAHAAWRTAREAAARLGQQAPVWLYADPPAPK
jgi:hypothetical protein